MPIEIRLTGAADLYSLRQALKKVGDAGHITRKMDKGFKAAVKPLQPEIRGEAISAMPSGYGPILSRSLAFRLSSRTAARTTELRLRVHADGQAEKRDLPALNRGLLRHPVFGRRRKAWVAQRVRSGVVDKPVERLLPRVQKEMAAVADQIAKEIEG